MQVLEASIEHLAWLRRLFKEFTVEDSQAYPLIDEEEVDNFTVLLSQVLMVGKDSPYRIFVAQVGKRIVGFLAVEVETRLVGKPHTIGLGHWLYVTPIHRKHGAASALIEAAVLWMQGKGCEVIELATTNAESWLRREVGFQPFVTRLWTTSDKLLERAEEMNRGQGEQRRRG